MSKFLTASFSPSTQPALSQIPDSRHSLTNCRFMPFEPLRRGYEQETLFIHLGCSRGRYWVSFQFPWALSVDAGQGR